MIEEKYSSYLNKLKLDNTERYLYKILNKHFNNINIKNKHFINFSSNDYLGLAHHAQIIAKTAEILYKYGLSSSSSRLVCGNLELFENFEQKIAHDKGFEDALIFNSGFQANASIIAALFDKTVIKDDIYIFSDKFNHASIHFGIKNTGLIQIRYKHNDLNHLESLLIKYQNKNGFKVIISETVFSMDGDIVNLAHLIELANKYKAFLYIDEAHSTGLYGKNGYGFASLYPQKINIAMGTFSKALGNFGAYIACSTITKKYLINKCHGFIYSTALPPVVIAGASLAWDLLPTLNLERQYLQTISAYFRQQLNKMNFNTLTSSTNIIPLLIGDEYKTIKLAEFLKEHHILAIAIRPPTVPSGTSRIRFSINAKHSYQEVDYVLEILYKWSKL